MPKRNEPLVTGKYYHVFNKTLDKRNIFSNDIYCSRFVNLLSYYRSSRSTLSYSRLSTLHKKTREQIKKTISFKKFFRVNLLCYSLMPNHFHLLLKQTKNKGIERLLSDCINSLTRYYNLTNNRLGPVFLPKFKAVRILSEEQLIHVSRYIHLNPFSSKVVKNLRDLILYKWSSYNEYILSSNSKSSLCDINDILALFGDDKKLYKRFVEGNAEHQRMLEQVKHVEKWI